MEIISFEKMKSLIDFDDNDENVKERQYLLENKFNYLNEYNVIIGSMKNIFKEITEIGHGAFADVFRGSEDKDFKILQEVIINKQLKHENIVNFYEYFIAFDDMNILYLNVLMELCDESLENWLKYSPSRNRKKSLKMFLDICKGLQHIHSLRFIHRDLKPANVLIGFDGICKISDFGLSTLHTARFETMKNYYHSIVGTINYAAPEQLEDKKYNFKADIFPLGLIFMELLTTFENNETVFVNIRENRNLPDGFEDHFKEEGELIIKMTEKDHLLRPTITEIIEQVNWIFNIQREMISMQEEMFDNIKIMQEIKNFEIKSTKMINSLNDEMDKIKNREKESLEQMREEMRKFIKDYNNKLKDSLEDVTKELIDTRNDLAATKDELTTTRNNLDYAKKDLANTRNELTATKNDMTIQLNDTNYKLEGLQKNPVPIGFIYVQLPDQPEPKNLWPTVKWENVTSDYAGLFFRAEGGGSSEFRETQNENAPKLAQVQFGWYKQERNDGPIPVPVGQWSGWLTSGIGGLNSMPSGLEWTTQRFYISGGEVRPRNKAVRIWKRINL